MALCAFSEVESVEFDAMVDFFRAAPEEVRIAFAIDACDLGLGATLDSHRRRGAQNALIALRLAEAAARGARVAVTETGERLPDQPSTSYRNILRAGFEEAYLRHNYMSPSA